MAKANELSRLGANLCLRVLRHEKKAVDRRFHCPGRGENYLEAIFEDGHLQERRHPPSASAAASAAFLRSGRCKGEAMVFLSFSGFAGYGCGSKRMGSHFEVGAPPILV